MKFPKLQPLARKRLDAFMRRRRSVWALAAFSAISAFCLCAEFVCPTSPYEIADTSTLPDGGKTTVEKTYDVKTARFNLSPDGEIYAYEGPAETRKLAEAAVSRHADGRSAECGNVPGHSVRVSRRNGYTRCFLVPDAPETVVERRVAAKGASFPHPPCKGHPFGLDSGGRDVYASVVHGMRISLLFGLALTLWAMLLGVTVGAVEGYFGGTADILMQRFTEIWSAVPFLYVMIFIGSTMGRSFTLLLICYGVFNWITVSYYMRAEFLRLRVRTFVEAAKCQGLSAGRIIFRHILPNAVSPLVTLFPFLLMGAIGSLAALDFLGFGLPPMTPSCGELMNQAQQFRRAWWLVLFPGAALFIVMFLAAIVGEGLREAFDPRGRSVLK